MGLWYLETVCTGTDGALSWHTFSNSSARSALLMLQANLLQGHEIVCQLAAALENSSVRPLGRHKRELILRTPVYLTEGACVEKKTSQLHLRYIFYG